MEIKSNNKKPKQLKKKHSFSLEKLRFSYRQLENNSFQKQFVLFQKFPSFQIFQKTKKKIPEETLRLLHIQKEMMVKQLIQFPDLYYAKSHFPLEISQRAFDHLWRLCESYELWCKETNQKKLILLNLTD